MLDLSKPAPHPSSESGEKQRLEPYSIEITAGRNCSLLGVWSTADVQAQPTFIGCAIRPDENRPDKIVRRISESSGFGKTLQNFGSAAKSGKNARI